MSQNHHDYFEKQIDKQESLLKDLQQQNTELNNRLIKIETQLGLLSKIVVIIPTIITIIGFIVNYLDAVMHI